MPSTTPTATGTPIVCTAASGPHVFVMYVHAYGRRAIVGGQSLPVTVLADPGTTAMLTVTLFDAPVHGGGQLYGATASSLVGADGSVTADVRVSYAPSRMVTGATLVVGARTACGTDSQRLAVVLLPRSRAAPGGAAYRAAAARRPQQ